MPSTKNSRIRRDKRHEEALARQEQREARGDRGQLIKVELLGYGEGKEAIRLRKKLGIATVSSQN